MVATAPNITERAMLVDLTVRIWTATKHDRKVSEEVAQTHNSDVTMGSYSKQLVSRDALERIRKIQNAAAGEHRRRTLPWMDNGARILSAAGYFEYAQAMRRFRTQFEDAVDDFCSAYPDYVEDAKRRLNGLFDPDEYPSLREIRGKFAMGYNVFPLPTARDFRVNLGAIEIARVQADIEENTQAAIREAMADVAGRIKEVVGRMVERLRAYTVTADGTSGVFRDTLVTNVRELVDLIPALNITDDPQLNEIAADMQTRLCLHEPLTLRASQEAREATADAAEEILARVLQFAR